MRFIGQKAIGRLEVAASQEGVDDDKGFEDDLDRRECRQRGNRNRNEVGFWDSHQHGKSRLAWSHSSHRVRARRREEDGCHQTHGTVGIPQPRCYRLSDVRDCVLPFEGTLHERVDVLFVRRERRRRWS